VIILMTMIMICIRYGAGVGSLIVLLRVARAGPGSDLLSGKAESGFVAPGP
jgi:hypothetical protein